MKKLFILLVIFLTCSFAVFAQEEQYTDDSQNYANEYPVEQDSTEQARSFKDSLYSLFKSTAFGMLIPSTPEDAKKKEAAAQQKYNEIYEAKAKEFENYFAPAQPTTWYQHPLLLNTIMIVVGLFLVWLAIAKGFEPLLLIPIGVGGILANVPLAGIATVPIKLAFGQTFVSDFVTGGFLGQIYSFGIESGLFPLFIFIGVGAMTDFGPLLANPKTALLGAAAQIGIFGTLIGALALSQTDLFNFTLRDAASIGIIGGADGPTAIFLASRLSPDLLGAIAVAAYSYMALVPIIQPPIMKALTTKKERAIVMKQLRPVSNREKIIFPLIVIVMVAFLLPDAAPLIGALMFGNLLRESGVTERLSKTAQNEFINIVTILLGLAVGSKLAADKFLRPETLGIILLGLIAFAMGTAGGVLLAKLMNTFSGKDKINPLIGAAGVSAVPMAARVVNKVGLETNPNNFLLMHAMGPNVSGVIGSAVAAGVLLAILG